MRVPVRIRLTAWYVALLGLVIAALAVFVVNRLGADLRGSIDRTLSTAASNIGRGWSAEGASEFHDVSATVLEGRQSGAQVLDARGRVLVSHGAPIAARPMLGHAGRATVTLAGEEYRVLAVPVTRRGERQLLVVAQSLDATEDATDRVLVLILIAGPALLLVTAAGGWWLAGKALRPVGQMAAKAERIEIDRLEERIAVPAVRDELGRLAATLNAMLDRLARGVQERQRLIADASHELRTPLAVMRSEIDVALDDGELPADAREVLESAREEVDRLTAIVRDLLTLAHVDEGRLALEREAVDLRELAQATASGLSALASRRDISLVVTGAPAVVSADAERLARALANLVDNAIKASPRGAEVTIASWARGDMAGVTVTDRGPGVPEEARERIFERFGRVDDARSRRDGGSGLGLAICRELVEAHGGRVSLESGAAGSAFTIALPRVPAPSSPSHGRAAPAARP